MNKIEYDEQCKSCKGTGLYIGIGERDGAAIICHTCKGTGCHHVCVEYDSFTIRQDNPNVRRVYKANPGICIGSNNSCTLADFGGMPVKEWESGLPFPLGSEDRKHTCPAWWDQCSGDYSGVTDTAWCNQFAGHRFADCIKFNEKEECWKLYDKLIKEKQDE